MSKRGQRYNRNCLDARFLFRFLDFGSRAHLINDTPLAEVEAGMAHSLALAASTPRKFSV